MFNNNLYSAIEKSLENLIILNDKNGEDDFRSYFVKELNNILPHVNIITPSTRSSDGDIRILNKKIEIKFINIRNKSLLKMSEIIEDFDSVIRCETDFFVIGFQMTLSKDEMDEYNNIMSVHEYINFHELKNGYQSKGTRYKFRNEPKKTVPYKAYSIFLGGSYIKDQVERLGKGKGRNSYIYFEKKQNIRSPYLLEVRQNEYIYVKVVGSIEDGVMYFLFSTAKGIEVVNKNKNSASKIDMVHNNDPYFFAEESKVEYCFIREPNALNNIQRDNPNNEIYFYKIYD